MALREGTDGHKNSPSYRTLSSVGAAAQKEREKEMGKKFLKKEKRKEKGGKKRKREGKNGKVKEK